MERFQKEKEEMKRRNLKAQKLERAAAQKRKAMSSSGGGAGAGAAAAAPAEDGDAQDRKRARVGTAPPAPDLELTNGAFVLGLCKERILKYLKRYGEPLDVHEVYGALKISTLYSATDRHRLTEDLRTNPKLEFGDDDLVAFKPTYAVANKEELIQLLRDFETNGMGGIDADLLQESYTGVSRDVEALIKEDKVFVLKPRKGKARFVLYNRDPALDMRVSDDVKKLWRSEKASVAAKHSNEVEAYLREKGLKPLETITIVEQKTKKKSKARKPVLDLPVAAPTLKITGAGP